MPSFVRADIRAEDGWLMRCVSFDATMEVIMNYVGSRGYNCSVLDIYMGRVL